MASVKTKEELTRLAWITELRRQGHRQCHGISSSGDKVCALVLLARLGKVELPSMSSCIGRAAGLDEEQSRMIIDLNDGRHGRRKHTFAEIADVVAGWFPST